MARETAGQRIVDCRQVAQELTAYLHSELPEDRRQAIQRHLQQCDDCFRTVQEARAFEAELRHETQYVRHKLAPLPQSASTEIQENVYRRMRRALLVQRTFQLTQQLGAAAMFLVFLLALALLFNPWRQQLAEMGTAVPASLIAPPATTQATLPPTLAPTATSVPTVPPPPNEPVNSPAQPEMITLPRDAAQSIIDAAISADDVMLQELLSRSHPLPEASYRVWRRLQRCEGQFSADDLIYRVILHEGRLASIYVFDSGGRYLGDIKMWLNAQSVWFVSTMNYSSFTALKHRCIE
jgi:hypothetical protein